jgi:hypothetical protein
VNAETASKAQQSCAGIDSTKPCGGGFATAVGPVRRIGPDVTPAGCTLPNFTVAFIGESAVRAVSLRRPVGGAPRFSVGLLMVGKTGFGGADGRGAFNPADSGGAGGRASGAAAGSGAGASELGGIGFRAIAEGGRTGAGDGGGKSALAASRSAGGRFGNMMRAGSVYPGRVGGGVLCGGELMRTVSFFGSFRSAIIKPLPSARLQRQRVSQSRSRLSIANPVRPASHIRASREFFA